MSIPGACSHSCWSNPYLDLVHGSPETGPGSGARSLCRGMPEEPNAQLPARRESIPGTKRVDGGAERKVRVYAHDLGSSHEQPVSDRKVARVAQLTPAWLSWAEGLGGPRALEHSK